MTVTAYQNEGPWPPGARDESYGTDIAFSPGGRWLFDLHDGFVLRGLKGAQHHRVPGQPTCAAFNRDDRRVAVGWEDGRVTVYDTETGTHLLTLRGGRDQRIAFVPAGPDPADGERLVSLDRDSNLVTIWDGRSRDRRER